MFICVNRLRICDKKEASPTYIQVDHIKRIESLDDYTIICFTHKNDYIYAKETMEQIMDLIDDGDVSILN